MKIYHQGAALEELTQSWAVWATQFQRRLQQAQVVLDEERMRGLTGPPTKRLNKYTALVTRRVIESWGDHNMDLDPTSAGRYLPVPWSGVSIMENRLIIRNRALARYRRDTSWLKKMCNRMKNLKNMMLR
jgi:hypothetical protein